MERKLVFITFLVILLTNLLGVAFRVEKVQASGTIYIRADGRVDPPTASLLTVDNITYTFTDNINDSIVVERSDIIIDGNGYTLQGSGSGNGFNLTTVALVTIQNTNIKNFDAGVFLVFSVNNIVSGNNITNNNYGVVIIGAAPNIVSGNNITNNNIGVFIHGSSHNEFYHNNFIDNAMQVYTPMGDDNFWDDGYPSGGNYWSDYTGVDQFSGPNQNDTGSDGIGDTAHALYDFNQDNYPYMNKDGWMPKHDVAVINVTTSKTGCLPMETVGQGSNVTVYATAENQGNSIETFNTTVTANANVTIIIGEQQVTLNPGENQTLIFQWDTTGVTYGNYTIEAIADTVPGETDIVDNTFTDGTVLVTIIGDIDGNRIVNIFDIVRIASRYMMTYPDPNWDPNSDIIEDGLINIFDVVAAASNYMKSW